MSVCRLMPCSCVRTHTFCIWRSETFNLSVCFCSHITTDALFNYLSCSLIQQIFYDWKSYSLLVFQTHVTCLILLLNHTTFLFELWTPTTCVFILSTCMTCVFIYTYMCIYVLWHVCLYIHTAFGFVLWTHQTCLFVFIFMKQHACI